ncbi:hypothetical protein [Phocoenobacter skyensis]|uniref:Uncharacterized protein n=1 Tax=Phocoenobacter skyensis TaxID=97481 RepID=A0A1H7YV75_9PAST|nr:hypothetical protein [Pasteurella skyensis]MDP8080023.1 hypothetical protein [Pasteurella skyensis]MDP8085957.1 hypothetical protein [Pasteurella skyensis]MDP8184788.1 hypothetical protein [Pasteurella skyensis]QLB22456.1 hypothetical protein A6B44_04255 [Pasteurella skyensis]SEM49825.1 hypothetical protein SAMN05444853_12058 [Pasteurella skyensis]
MKIGKKFNTFTKSEYFYYIDNRKKYTDFNELGLYRSICENDKLDLADKIEIRDYANQFFSKTFEFYQVKDPDTYFALTTLGMKLTDVEKKQVMSKIYENQQKILKKKRIKHRNFGIYSKDTCGNEHCHLNGMMTKQYEWYLNDCNQMGYDYYKSEGKKEKSQRLKKERKNIKQIIDENLQE